MKASVPKRRVVLSLLAHPDDAEILCGGTLLRLRDLGWDVHIASATPGDCGSATLLPDQIASIRRSEGQAAARLLGGTFHCLEERDVNVVYDKGTNRKAIDLFRRIAPVLVFTHPRFDYMLDHEQVHQLSRSAAFSYSILNASTLPLHADSVIPWLYYCDALEGRDPYSGHLIEPSASIDITNVMERKIEMLACHASQREWLRAHHGIDEYLEHMKRHNAMRGRAINSQFAEAFTQHRGHPFPTTDILHELLGGNRNATTNQ